MRILLITILITFSNLAIAQEPWPKATKNWRESPNLSMYLHSVPAFCSFSADPRSKKIDWKKKFGRGMTWGNHYCYAQIKMPICREYFGNHKIACLKAQTEGFTYWINHVEPNFKLLPFIYLGYGDLLTEIGDTNQAIIQYKNVLKKNKKYIKAYQGLIDSYIKIGALKEAEVTVNTALKIKKTKSLIKQQQKIDKLLSSH